MCLPNKPKERLERGSGSCQKSISSNTRKSVAHVNFKKVYFVSTAPQIRPGCMGGWLIPPLVENPKEFDQRKIFEKISRSAAGLLSQFPRRYALLLNKGWRRRPQEEIRPLRAEWPSDDRIWRTVWRPYVLSGIRNNPEKTINKRLWFWGRVSLGNSQITLPFQSEWRLVKCISPVHCIMCSLYANKLSRYTFKNYRLIFLVSFKRTANKILIAYERGNNHRLK